MKAGGAIDFSFTRDLLSARRADGEAIVFTRQERTILLRLIGSPGRLLRREVLMGAIAGDGLEPGNDRHIDFLISQLRRKLGDSARAPRFIRTQYGEGYVWIGDVPPAETNATSPLLGIGPLYGGHLPGADALIGGLTAALSERLGAARIAVSGGGSAARPNYSLEASIYDDRSGLSAAMVLRDSRTSAAIGSYRLAAAPGQSGSAVSDMADRIARGIWSSSALHDPAAPLGPREPPPWVRLFEAGLLMTGDLQTWRGNLAKLEGLLAQHPGDASLEVMRGLNLYTWLIQSLYDPSGALISQEKWRSIEDQIEIIALYALPHLGDQPMMQLAVAKLLLFINRGYVHLGTRIADDILANSNVHAAAFAVAGEAAGLTGDFKRAIDLLERGVELSEPGSYFQIYLLVIEATMLLAANETSQLIRLTQLMHNVSTSAHETLTTFCALPGYDETKTFHTFVARDAQCASDALRFHFNVSSRRFLLRRHRRNAIRPLATALVQRFGLDIIPEEVDLATGIRAEIGKKMGVLATA